VAAHPAKVTSSTQRSCPTERTPRHGASTPVVGVRRHEAPGARVVKAFNTTFAGTLGEGIVAGQPLDVLIASDDEEAKRAVTGIVADAGLRPIDAGPLRRARELEALGYLHMAIQQPLQTNFGGTVKVRA
jgi:predicted dinucleotide-binding enzyme